MKEMEKEEMKKFVENVGRKELFEDMKQNGGYPRSTSTDNTRIPPPL